VAPESSSTVGVPPGTGSTVAMAGRCTPGMRPIRSSAAATAAPVLPALTMADACPSLTASAARTTDESFLRRTAAAGSSSIATISDAGSTSRLPVSPSASGWPTSTTGMPCCSTAWRAPATISAGPRSPPMASTAIGREVTAPAGGIGARARSRRQSTMMACRPPYQPQFAHTTGGIFAFRHWGQVLRGGAARCQALVRRLRLLAFDVFFLGTAIGQLASLGRTRASLPERAD
jgi:hypothetical protein